MLTSEFLRREFVPALLKPARKLRPLDEARWITNTDQARDIDIAACKTWQQLDPELAGLVPNPSHWSPALALYVMDVVQVEFVSNNRERLLGYSTSKTVALSPRLRSPLLILLHELAHIALRHTLRELPEPLKEAQVQLVALGCAALLGIHLPDVIRVHKRYMAHDLADLGRSLTEAEVQECAEAMATILNAGARWQN